LEKKSLRCFRWHVINVLFGGSGVAMVRGLAGAVRSELRSQHSCAGAAAALASCTCRLAQHTPASRYRARLLHRIQGTLNHKLYEQSISILDDIGQEANVER
jgi:hypothetical protein